MNRYLLSGLAGGVLLATLCRDVLVADATTDTVKGRAPVSAPTITGTAAFGQALTVNKGSSDADGDAELGSAVQWLDAGGVLAGHRCEHHRSGCGYGGHFSSNQRSARGYLGAFCPAGYG